MNSHELNTALTMELINYRNTDELTPDLKRLLMELVWEISHDRYKSLSENLRIMCEAKAYEHVCKHSIHFNQKTCGNAKSYVSVIIRSAFAGTICKHGNFKKTVEI
jgi:hypothetical protein